MRGIGEPMEAITVGGFEGEDVSWSKIEDYTTKSRGEDSGVNPSVGNGSLLVSNMIVGRTRRGVGTDVPGVSRRSDRIGLADDTKLICW